MHPRGILSRAAFAAPPHFCAPLPPARSARQYDGNSNLTQFTDRRGKITVYQYDGLNRRIFVGFGQSGSSYESSINYSCDAGDRLSQAVDSIAGTITRSFDGLDDLLAETTPQGSLSWSYDSARRRSSTQGRGSRPSTIRGTMPIG